MALKWASDEAEQHRGAHAEVKEEFSSNAVDQLIYLVVNMKTSHPSA